MSVKETPSKSEASSEHSEPFKSPEEKNDSTPKAKAETTEDIEQDEVVENEEEIEISGSYQRGKLTITVGVELWPADEPIIITSTDEMGQVSPKFLNGKILKRLGVDPDSITLDEEQLAYLNETGYVNIEINNRQVFFVLTLVLNQKEQISPDRVQHNLFNLFNEILSHQEVSSTSIYLPLLGTGSTGLPISSSFEMTLSALESFASSSDKEMNITLSIPPETDQEDRMTIKNYFDGWEQVSNARHQDKIDFHLDDPTLEDKLGRRPVAKSLARLINNDIFNQNTNQAFMAHLQGRWGEGKTSFMKFLEEELQETGNNNWIIVNYNAWQHQYVDPPWWTFLDALYTQSVEQIAQKNGKTIRLKFREFLRRMNKSPLLALAIVLFVALIILLIHVSSTSMFAEFSETAKAIISFFTLAGSAYGIAQAWSKFFILDTPENAKLFMKRAENPAKRIKNHFENLVSDIENSHPEENSKFKIAFFIDDLDRCDNTFVVKLLEGIQTMFRNSKVFYLVAADKHWIAQSFELEYADYEKTAKEGTRLGYSFIEKNFQLSLRLPYSTPNQIKKYWDYILKREDDDETDESKIENTKNLKNKIKSMQQKDILSGGANINQLSKDYNVTIEDAQEAVLEAVNESTRDIEHLLKDFHGLIGNNPRAVKRLANQYTVYRNLILVERNKVDPLRLFRWVILQNRWPILADEIQKIPPKIEKVDNHLDGLKLSSQKNDINFVLGKGDERLTENDVKVFLGLSNQ